MSAAIYTRQSLDRTGEAAGVTRQLEECRALAANKGITVTHELSDNDTSATTGVKRPQFDELLRLVENGEVDTVIVWHPDRLYRKLKDLVKITEVAERRGLTISSVQSADIDLSTPSGRMNASILGAVATHEGEHRTQRQKNAFRQRAEAGEWHFSHRPFGYRRIARAVVLEPAEAEIARDIMTRYYELGESRHALAKSLNERGILTPQNKPWGIIQLRDFLANARYAGIALYNGVEIGVGNWPAIIDETDWRRWQSKTAKRKRKSTFTSARYLLTGIARCGVCGGVCYVKHRARDDSSLSYACQAKSCVSRNVANTDRYIEGVVVARLQQPNALESLKPKSQPTAELFAERADIQNRLDDLAELVADGTLSAPAARDAAKPLRSKIGAIDARIESSRGVEGLPLDELAKDVPARWATLTLPQKRIIIRGLMSVKIHPQGGKKTFDPAAVQVVWKT